MVQCGNQTIDYIHKIIIFQHEVAGVEGETDKIILHRVQKMTWKECLYGTLMRLLLYSIHYLLDPLHKDMER